MLHALLPASRQRQWRLAASASPILALAAMLVASSLAPAFAQSPGELLRRDLEAGRAAEAVKALKPLAASNVDARMALGFAEFTVAVEKLLQGLHRFGLKTPQNPFLPIVRLPVPDNAQPEAVDYAKLRALYQAFLNDLAIARTTLSSVTATDGKLVLDLAALRFTIAPQSNLQGGLTLRDVLKVLGGGRSSGIEPWEVAFDRADTLWLAGYCHMLSALMEFVMAHDWQKTFDATAHLFFAGARMPKDIMPPDAHDQQAMMNAMGGGIADQIALLHLIQWPTGDKARLSAARMHLKSAIALSRETWKAVLAETDDDREWLAGPKQNNRAVPTMPITDEIVASWLAVLDDFDAVLDGRKLLAHWRSNKGIDLRMLFEDPRPFDLVLWITGHGAMPFLRDGPMLDGTAWQQWNRLFRGNFLGYAFFIN